MLISLINNRLFFGTIFSATHLVLTKLISNFCWQTICASIITSDVADFAYNFKVKNLFDF